MINRTARVTRAAGGKGNNVARVAKTLGSTVTVIQPLGGADGEFIVKELANQQINCCYIQITNHTRRCLAIISENGGITELRENGPYLTRDETQQFMDLYKREIITASIVSASGSLPDNVQQHIYQQLITIAKKAGVPFFLDAKGEALRYGISAKPTMVKINEDELSEYCGSELRTESDYFNALGSLHGQGIEIAIVSLGAQGMLAHWRGQKFAVKVPQVKVVSPVGCGDATLAGLAYGYQQQYSPQQTLQCGAAAGTAAAMQAATGTIDINDYLSLLPKIEIKKFN